MLKANYAETLRRLERIRNDESDPAERGVHHWQKCNPVVLEGLVQTILGAPNHIYHGGLLHCRLFYFDPVLKRPGLPQGVAALVDKISPDGVSVHLVNLDPSQPRSVIVRDGAFGEHEFTSVRHKNQSTPICRNFIPMSTRPPAPACRRIWKNLLGLEPASVPEDWDLDVAREQGLMAGDNETS